MDQGPSSSAKDSDAPNVDEWRRRVQDKTLAPKELIDFFKSVAPSLFLTESARNPAELGELRCSTASESGGKRVGVGGRRVFIIRTKQIAVIEAVVVAV